MAPMLQLSLLRGMDKQHSRVIPSRTTVHTPSLQPRILLTGRLPHLPAGMHSHSTQPRTDSLLHLLRMARLRLELRATVSLLRVMGQAATPIQPQPLLRQPRTALRLVTALRLLILDMASRRPPLHRVVAVRVIPRGHTPSKGATRLSSLPTEGSSRPHTAKVLPSRLQVQPTLPSPMAHMVKLASTASLGPLRVPMTSLATMADTTRAGLTAALSPHSAEATTEKVEAGMDSTGRGCAAGLGVVGQWVGEAWGPGMDREMGGEQDDSENCAIYITGLTEKATVEEMAEFFKHVGAIRMNRRLGHQAINIYTDRDSGKPKGDATLSYEDPQCARAAVEYFNGKEFQGRKLNVSMARRKNPPGMMRGGMPMRGGPHMDRGGMMGRGADRGGFPPRGGPRGGMPWGGPPGGGNMPKRVGDWECASPGCGNQNFAWRTECNQCKAPRPEGMGPPPGAERGRGGMGRGGRGMPGERGGPGGMRGGWGGEPGGFRGGRGGMDHGGFRGGSRGGPPMDRGARRGMGPGKMDMREGRPDRRDRPY